MIQKFIDSQYRRPTGIIGRVIGSRMARDHRPENLWTVAQLHVQPADALLELGFGPGVAIQELSRLAVRGRVAGIDYSKAMVRVARQRNAAAIAQGCVELRYGDVTALPFADATFDKAFGIHTIYFWKRPLAALREVLRVLKPGGMLLLTILPKEQWNIHDPTAAVGTPDCTPYSGAEIAQLLAEAGFANTTIVRDDAANLPSNFCVIGFKPEGECESSSMSCDS